MILPENDNMKPVLFLLIPCYRDSLTLEASTPILRSKLEKLVKDGIVSEKSRVMFVNDGSPDDTWEKIRIISESDPFFCGINLAENKGEQTAHIAGLTFCVELADCIITMDSDLQDDINTVDKMLRCYRDGFDVVLGVRSMRWDDSALEKLTSFIFYYTMTLFRTGQTPQHSNCRLLSKKAISELLDKANDPFFLPCIASGLNQRTTIVHYKRLKRVAGKSGYNFSKRLKLGLFALLAHAPAFTFLKNRLRKYSPKTWDISETVGFND